MELTGEWLNLSETLMLEDGTRYTVQNTSRNDTHVVLDIREATDTDAESDHPLFMRSREAPWTIHQRDECVVFARSANPEERAYISVIEQ